MSKYRICVDAGHGGKDSGAVGNGLLEKNLNLIVSLKLSEILNKDDRFEAILTRSTDVFVELSERARIANNFRAHLFVSVHFNAYNQKAFGVEVLDYNGTGLGRVVGQAFVDILEKEHGAFDRGIRATHSAFAVIRETKCPSIITESAFIDNPLDIQKFDEPHELAILAYDHYRAICAGFGVQAKSELHPNYKAPEPAYDHAKALSQAAAQKLGLSDPAYWEERIRKDQYIQWLFEKIVK